MGEHGAASRILYKRLGRPWTYAALSQGTPSAPGQLAVSVLRTIYRAPQLDRQTELYGLFGNPIAQSPGYLFHNSFYQARGLNAVYLPWRVESEELHTCLDTALELGFSGLSITIPHKTTVFDWVEKTRIDAAEIGAINTLLLKNGQRYGTNTDADAAADAIEAQLGPLKRLKVCILGAGGAARALLYACMARGATVELRARRTEAAKELATQFQALSAQWDDALSPQLDLLINTTPSSCYLDSHSLPQGCALMDLNPQGALDQRLERYARRGHRLISGKDMFERQAEAQNKLWFPNLATFHSTK
jgi:shikimate dehydrogenase